MTGTDAFEEFSKERNGDFMKLKREVECKKKLIKQNGPSKIRLTIPQSLKRLAMQSPHFGLAEGTKWVQDELAIPMQTCLEFFTPSITAILKHTKSILEDPKLANVKMILLVGYGSESEPVKDAFKQEFSPTYKVIIPDGAGESIIKGAVMFGVNAKPDVQNHITERTVQATYGVKVTKPFVSGLHPENEVEIIEGQQLCRLVFDKLIEIGETIPVDYCVKRKYAKLQENQRSQSLQIYMSQKRDPKHVKAQGTTQMGTLTYEIPEGYNGDIIVEFFFGRQEISIRAQTEMKGKVAEILLTSSLDFL